MNANKPAVEVLLLLRCDMTSTCSKYKLKSGLLEEFSQWYEATFRRWAQLWSLHSMYSVFKLAGL